VDKVIDMFNHRTVLQFTGFTWIVMGAWILYKGLKFVSYGGFAQNSFCSRFGEPGSSIAFLMTAGLLIGYLKGKVVLQKTVWRVASRLQSLPFPLRLKDLYAPSYLLLIGAMMVLGMLLNVLPIPLEFRGFVDIVIGSALINGSLFYFKFARQMGKTHS
jgi:hypothetical protein